MKIMKYILSTFFIFTSIQLSAQVIYNDQQDPLLKTDDWNWINSNNKNELAHKHLVLEFWASWCGSCIAAIPHINELNTRFSKDVAFVSVNSYDTQAVIEKSIKKHKIESYVIMDEDKYLKDLFHIQLIPTTILIDKNGILRWKGLANQLTTELLEGFIQTDTIHSVIDTSLIDQSFIITDVTKNIAAPAQLKVTRLIVKQFQRSTTSLHINFDSTPVIEMKNWTIPKTIQTLLNTEKEEKVAVTFSGNVPDNYSIDFLATSNQKIEKKLFLSKTIRVFSDGLNISIDTFPKQRKVQNLTSNAKKLKPFLSTNQQGNMSFDEVEDRYVIQHFTLKKLAEFLSYQTNESIIFEGEDQQQYNLEILKTSDFSKMKRFLKNKYCIKFKEKEVERNQYEFTFH